MTRTALARAYWAYLSRISLGILRVVYEPDARTVVVLSRRLPLLRFHVPDYETEAERASVTWRIERGLLVAREGEAEGQGFLRISVRRLEGGAEPGQARIEDQRVEPDRTIDLGVYSPAMDIVTRVRVLRGSCGSRAPGASAGHRARRRCRLPGPSGSSCRPGGRLASSTSTCGPAR